MKTPKRGEPWQRAIAALALQRFKDVPPADKVLRLLTKLNSRKLRILDFIAPNLVLFKKMDCDYAFVGKQLEKWLLTYFNLKR